MDDELLQRAVEALRKGELLGLPTETVYGLAADASNELAVRRIFAAKGRPSTHPLIVHVPSLEAARPWALPLPPAAEALAAAHWPGPLTLVVARSPRASDAVTGGQPTVALRVPAHPVALAVLEAFGGGLAAPSANRFGRVSPTTAEHVRSELGAEVALVLDGGPSRIGLESTIVDLAHGAPRLLRPGGLPVEALERTLGQPVARAQDATDVRAPGMLASHYAPRAGVRLVPAAELASVAAQAVAQGNRVVVLSSPSVPTPAGAVRLEVPEDLEGLARVLYARLREADEGADLILIVPPPEVGMGLAIVDRLKRAAAPRPGGAA